MSTQHYYHIGETVQRRVFFEELESLTAEWISDLRYRNPQPLMHIFTGKATDEEIDSEISDLSAELLSYMHWKRINEFTIELIFD